LKGRRNAALSYVKHPMRIGCQDSGRMIALCEARSATRACALILSSRCGQNRSAATRRGAGTSGALGNRTSVLQSFGCGDWQCPWAYCRLFV
jgi:hypothetical protein